MTTPLFNYSAKLLDQVHQAGILFSEQSVLKLNCTQEKRTSEQRRALENFDRWKDRFTDNCNGHFYAASPVLIDAFEKNYKADLLSAMLIAELYDWTTFKSLDELNDKSIFMWQGEDLKKSRAFSDLV